MADRIETFKRIKKEFNFDLMEGMDLKVFEADLESAWLDACARTVSIDEYSYTVSKLADKWYKRGSDSPGLYGKNDSDIEAA